MNSSQPARTITVTARSRSRLARLRLHYPAGTRQSWLTRLRPGYPDKARRLRYDASLARELLANTCELPDSKRDIVMILAEHRQALHDLLATADSQKARTFQPDAPPPDLPRTSS